MLHQYHGNDMEVLRALACELLAKDPPPPLVAENLVVPNVGMAKWLRQGIAARLGVAANLYSDLPAAFVARLAGTVLSSGDTTVDRAYGKEQLAIRLLRLLPTLLEEPDFGQLRAYLEGRQDPRRLLALCRRVAALFDQYLVYRPDWMLAWEQGHDAHGNPEAGAPWQPALWRALIAQIRTGHPDAIHGATRTRRLIETLREAASPPAGVPQRITGFGLGALPPLWLELFEVLGTHAEVRLFQFNPCAEFWGDTVSERTRARWALLAPARAEHAEVGNALLGSWGRLGREQLQLLLEHTGGDIESCFAERNTTAVLGAIQHDILRLAEPATPRALAPGDTSLVFAEAHSRLREVEALHDELLARFAGMTALHPREVVVMAPDITLYSPSIEAVFGEMRGSERYIPYSIADRAASAESPHARSLLHLLALPESRFGASEIGALLAVPAIAARFGLNEAALEEVRGWIAHSGIRWGLGADAAVGVGPGIARNTWRFGLERMLLGVALDGEVPFGDVAPLALGGAEAGERLGMLAEFIAQIEQHARALTRPRSVAAWRSTLALLIEDFYAREHAFEAELAELRAAIAAVFELLDASGFDGTLERELIVDLLGERFGQSDGSHQFLRGGVSFCQLTPLRSIPFRVVCLLGMNADAYPRHHERAGFDLMGQQRRSGDPTRRDDDRYLFLESLIAARDCLYISHVARDERSNARREPTLPLCELRDYVDTHWGKGAADSLTRRHHLKPFNVEYFQPEARLFSYRSEWLPAARSATLAPRLTEVALAPRPLTALGIDALSRFYRNPCKAFFNERFGVRFAEPGEIAEDCEPFALDALQLHQMKQELVDAALANTDPRAFEHALLARGDLPLGHAGVQLLREARATVQDLVVRIEPWSHIPLRSVDIELTIGARALRGTLEKLRGSSLHAFTASSEARGNTLVDFWIRHLCACAAGVLDGASTFDDRKKTHTLVLLDSQVAHAHLADLIVLHDEGMCRPLPLFAKAAFAWARSMQDKSDADVALKAARVVFNGYMDVPGEHDDRYIARAYPDAGDALGAQFTALAERVFLPLAAALAGELR